MTDLGQIRRKFGLGPIDQISFAVENAEEAAIRFEPLFGPFQLVEVTLGDILYRGQPASAVLRLGFAQPGPIEVELVQVLEGACPIADHLAEHGESLHHVRFPVTDFEGTRAAMEAAGYVTTFMGGSGGTNFAYLEAPSLPLSSIELLRR